MNIRYAFKRSLPVMAGYLVLGMGFGILLEANGYGVWWAFCMSLFIYAGSMQYVAVDLLTGGASLLAAALMTLMVNARHLFYGISMIDRYKDTGAKKPYLIFALTDETYSLVCSGEVPEGVDKNRYFFLVSLLNQSYWIAGSVAGAFIGSLLTFNTSGIEFSMTALFIVVFVEQWKGTSNHLSSLIGVAASLVCLFIFGAERFLIPSMLAITTALMVLRKIPCTKQAEKGGDADE
ncbi:AzlC family ABC transporter permease [Parablautia intestinalis]|uniref:AzlC family ABC transporter permease n=1 Tax=Parablautia intestinalis TaxID=2320100 RepID=UPI00256F04F6|nr:AzlC family ABC transporter permease [Parablautia intestinalis]